MENEKMKVRKLPGGADLSDVRPNIVYLGKILSNGLVSLNNMVKGRLVNPDSLDKDEGDIAVKVVRISLPFGLDLEYVPGDFEIVEKTQDIGKMTLDDLGKEFVVYAQVKGIRQSSGPTLFTLSDGTGSIVAKAFAGPGKRSFPDIQEGMWISAKLTLKEYDNTLEAGLLSYKPLSESSQKELEKKVDSLMQERAKPDEVDFLIENPVLDKLRNRMREFATIVKRAVLESRPIVIRHHADCDGYCGGIALEKAILPLIMDMHDDSKAAWRYYRRSPSKAPFYEYADVIKDLTYALDDMERFGLKEPLIILVDNGSTDEDILGIKKMRLYGAQVIVLDHHYPGETDEYCKLPVDYHVDAHVNPHGVGGDWNLTAGMIAVETARMINKEVSGVEFLPALAGIGDHVVGEVFERYKDLAKEKGYDEAFLRKLAKVVDFEAFYLRFIESRGLVNDLLGADRKKQDGLIELLIPEIQLLEEEQLKSARYYCRIEEHEKVAIVRIDMGKVNSAGSYPAMGKATGLLHDSVAKELGKQVITLSYGPDMVIFRAAEGEFGFNVHEVLRYVKEKVPHGSVEGGGHEVAGTIKFAEAARDEVLAAVDEFLRENIKG